MRNFGIVLSLVVMLSTGGAAFADPPPGSLDVQDRLVIEACYLSSEKPHISKHVPETVNVTGRTICKGISAGRQIKVTVTLTRLDGGNTPSITKSITGVGKVIVNVAMPCIWARNQALNKYTITTTHRMSNGKIGTTKNKAELKC
jgi:hypothetical protein